MVIRTQQIHSFPVFDGLDFWAHYTSLLPFVLSIDHACVWFVRSFS
jgi:hypothetical protein